MGKKRSLTETLTSGVRDDHESNNHEDLVIQAMNAADLDRIAAQALDVTQAVVVDSRSSPFDTGIGIGTSVHQVGGNATVGGRERDWSAVLKILTERPGQEEPDGAFYWRREAELLCCETLAAESRGFRPPRCYEVVELANDAAAVFMEFVPQSAEQWTLDLFEKTAYRIGQFSGFWYGRIDQGQHSWLNSHRGFVESFFPLVDITINKLQQRFESESDDPLMVITNEFICEWEQIQRYLTIYKTLPTTLCHFDANDTNLIWSGKGTGDLVAIDWAYSGPGALGQDVVVLTTKPTRQWEIITPAELPTLIHHIIDGYIHGLEDVGCSGRDDEARMGYFSTSAVGWCGKSLLSLEKLIASEMENTHIDLDTETKAIMDAYAYCKAELTGMRAP